jgi:hypothetical protein
MFKAKAFTSVLHSEGSMRCRKRLAVEHDPACAIVDAYRLALSFV